MTRCPLAALLAAGLLIGALAFPLPVRADPPRGELLYSTHCIACHNTQKHWREKKVATDWGSLMAQVRRWQAAAMLQWPEEDVLEVTRYLNDTFYRFEPVCEPRG